MKTFNLPALALLSALSSSAFAGEPTALSWQNCMALAKASNPTLLAAQHSLESAKSKYYVSLNTFFPSLNLSHSVSRSGSGSGRSPDAWSAGESLNWSLLNFSNIKDLKSKQTALRQAEEVLRQAEVNLRKNLRIAFADLLYNQEKIGLMESIAELRIKNSKMVSLQYDSGRESKGNMMRAQALAAQAVSDISKARLTLSSAQRSLLALMGQDALRVVTASGTLSVPGRGPDPDVETVAQNAPDVKVSAYTVQLYEIQFESAKVSGYPTLTASQSLNWTGAQEFPNQRSWGVGLSLSLPIFSGGPTSYWNSKNSAMQLYLKAKEDYRQTLLNTRYTAQNAWSNLLSSIYDCDVDQQLLAASDQRHNESTIKYLAGSMIFENWETVEQEFVNAEKSYLDALRSAAAAEANWLALAGTTLGDRP
ncbi:MAG TPA: TolC family protein [Elusimicrobiales bacterium]|nr:TolC family protein [Elusimicrobiales bacterium]